MLTRITFYAAAISIVGIPISACVRDGSDGFAMLLDEYNKQFRIEASFKYQKKVIELRIFERLHENSGCFSKGPESLTVIVDIDESGKVRNTIASIDGQKASCFRKSYSKAQLPVPPNHRFLYAMEMIGDDGFNKYHSDPGDGGGAGPRMPSSPPKCSSKTGCGL